MPTYEYECKACNTRFERIQKMTDPSITECPDCAGPVRKVMHPPAISFKGTGFYVNDYKNASSPPSESGGEGKPAGSGDAKSETATDAKTDAKSEAKPETKAEPKADKPAEPAAKG